MKVNFNTQINTQSLNFGKLKVYGSSETKRVITDIVNYDDATAKAYQDAYNRIDIASGDIPVTLWGRGDSLRLSSAKYPKRQGRGGLPQSDAIKRDMDVEKKIEILNNWAHTFETFMGKSGGPASEVMGSLNKYC